MSRAKRAAIYQLLLLYGFEMALRYERRHLAYPTAYHRRISGQSQSVAECCILLEDGPPEVILLEDGGGCIAPQDC
jgi:hypothetical protein